MRDNKTLLYALFTFLVVATPLVAQDVQKYVEQANREGNAFIEQADAVFANPEAKPEEKIAAFSAKYWGISRKFHESNEDFERELNRFVDSVKNEPDLAESYSVVLEVRYSDERDKIDRLKNPAEKIAAFAKFRDEFLPIIEKTCGEIDPNQKVVQLYTLASLFDSDGSAGLLLETVEKLRPVLDEQKKSEDRWTKHLAEGADHAVRRVQMPGKEMVLEGLSTEGNIVDIKDYRGKVVLLQFGSSTKDSPREHLIPLVKKTHSILHEKGLEILEYDIDDDRTILRQKVNDAELPWPVLCRDGVYEKELTDYYVHYNARRETLFLIDRNGIVVKTWSAGLCPGFWAELAKLFPENQNEIATFAEENLQLVREYKEKYRDSRAAGDYDYFGIKEGEKSEYDRLVDQLRRMALSSFYSGDSQGKLQTILELADLILELPDLNPDQRRAARSRKINLLLQWQGVLEEREHPERSPLVIYEECLRLIDEALADGSYHSHTLFDKMRVLQKMPDYIERSPNPKKDVEELLKIYLPILEKETQQTHPYGGAGLRTLTYFMLKAFDEIDNNGTKNYAVNWINAVLPYFENAKDYELQEYAKTLKTTSQRVSLHGKELAFECVLLDGSKLNVKDLRGQIVLLNFWNTQCAPCLGEFPNMKVQYEKYKPQGFEMIAYSGDSLDDLTSFVEKTQYPWKTGSIVLSKENGLVDYDLQIGISAVPTTFLLDREGKVIFQQVGDNDERLNAALEEAFR